MVALPKDPKDFIEIAYFNRDICIELSSLLEKEALRGHFKSKAEMWEKFAENVKRDLQRIAESRELLAKIDKQFRF